jgi:hypothetical protein
MKTSSILSISLLVASISSHATIDTLVPYGSVYNTVKINGVTQTSKTAPFGTGSGCAVQSDVKTYWPSYAELILKRNFIISAQHKKTTIYFGVDNRLYRKPTLSC